MISVKGAGDSSESEGSDCGGHGTPCVRYAYGICILCFVHTAFVWSLCLSSVSPVSPPVSSFV